MKYYIKIIFFFICFLLVGFNEFKANEFDEFDQFKDLNKNEITVYDPFESFNRWSLGINDKVYVHLLGPVLDLYSNITSESMRQGLSNFFNNLKYPISLVNNGLQFKFKNMKTETYRFCINSTLGLFGFFDVAKESMGINSKFEDFGQTLGYWGIPPGPFLVLPILGPTTPRQLVGSISGIQLDMLSSPIEQVNIVNLIELDNSWKYLKGLDTLNVGASAYENYKQIKAVSLDLYTVIKIGYMEIKTKQIKE